MLNASLNAIEAGENGANPHQAWLHLQGKTPLLADVMVFATGTLANVQLAQDAGLAVDQGILVNDQLQSSHDHIYALGECAQWRHQRVGFVAPAYDQARVLAQVLAGKNAKYQPQPQSTQLKLAGVDVYIAGDLNENTADEIMEDLTTAGIYRQWFIRQDQLQGVRMVGTLQDSNFYFKLIRQQTPLAGKASGLVVGKLAF